MLAVLVAVTFFDDSLHFGMNQTGTIYQSTKHMNAYYTGAPPSSATVIK